MGTIFGSGRVFRGALCAVVAVMATTLGGWGFLVSTAHAPGDHPPAAIVGSPQIPLDHSVFGRPEPAVLVD